MRLNSYINEKILVDLEKIITTLKKDCGHILRYYKTQGPLYRGIITQGVFFPKVGHDTGRNPKDTPKWAHDYMNDKLQSKFGWKVRDGVSVSTQHRQAVAYGTVHVFFPVNGFKWAYIKDVKDVFQFIDDNIGVIDTRKFNSGYEGYDAWNEKFGPDDSRGNFKLTKSTSPYREAGLDDVLDEVVEKYTDKPWKGHVGEVLFDTKKYYMLNLGFLDDEAVDLFKELDIFQHAAVTIK